MAQECTACGKNYNKNKSTWRNCPTCQQVYCPDCLDNMLKSQKDKSKKRSESIEKAKDLNTYKELVCPDCGTEMMRF